MATLAAVPSITVPDYAGGSLVNLIAELETRLGASPPSPRLHPALGALIPEATSYVLVVFDGLGDLQLDHPVAAGLDAWRVGALDAPFPATTTVSLASIATGLAPSQHGLLGYQLWIPELGQVANTIKWTTLWGEPLDYETEGLLPQPNTWERLVSSGAEPITIQPAGFAGTPLTRALYRGCRFEAITTVDEWVDATATLAAVPGRLVLAYLPQVDFAAHVYGQHHEKYAAALRTVSLAWSRLAHRLPAAVVAVGTADHGHVDFPDGRQIKIAKADHVGRTFYGDGRAMFVRGDGAALAASLPATWYPLAEMIHWWGPKDRHPSFGGRAPDGVLVADDDVLLLHRHADDRMIGNHGALTDAERVIPLLSARQP
jgi:hypothetical protein